MEILKRWNMDGVVVEMVSISITPEENQRRMDECERICSEIICRAQERRLLARHKKSGA